MYSKKALTIVSFIIVLTMTLLAFFSLQFWIKRQDLLKNTLFTSPHTIRTVRFVINSDGSQSPIIHKREMFVDEILDKIGQQGYQVFYNTNDEIDPNYEEVSQFRKESYKGQKYNLDIHGMSDKYEVDIAIGTAEKSYNLNRVRNYLEKNSLKVDINGLFEGQSRSISKFLSTKHGVKALQIEISLQTRQRSDIDQILIQTAKIFVEDN